MPKRCATPSFESSLYTPGTVVHTKLQAVDSKRHAIAAARGSFCGFSPENDRSETVASRVTRTARVACTCTLFASSFVRSECPLRGAAFFCFRRQASARACDLSCLPVSARLQHVAAGVRREGAGFNLLSRLPAVACPVRAVINSNHNYAPREASGRRRSFFHAIRLSQSRSWRSLAGVSA